MCWLQPGLAACVPHVLVAAGLVAAHYRIAQRAGIVKGELFGARLASVPWIFASYWRLLFFPLHLATPHAREPLAWSELGTIVPSLVAAVAVVVAVWFAAPRRTLALFCLGWWFALLLPVSNLVPLSMLVAERYMYLPLVGACAFAAYLVGSLLARRRAVVLAGAMVVVALFATATRHRNPVWRNSRTFWKDGTSKWPGAPVQRLGLAATYADENQLESAWRQYMSVALAWGMAYSRNPAHIRMVNAGITACYDRVARKREAEGEGAAALRVYQTVATLMPQQVEPRVKLAEAYERHGMLEKAREQVEHIRKIDKDYPGLDAWLKRLEEKGRARGASEGEG